MLFGQLTDNICDRFAIPRNDAARAILRDKVNLIYKEVGNITNVNWETLKRTGEIVTVPNYTTGTCTITNGSRTVTFAGATLTSAMAGRYFKPQTSNNWYLIVAVPDASTLVLRSAIIESSGTSLTYNIWKRYYYLPSEVRKLINFGSWISGGELVERTENKLLKGGTDVSLVGDPGEFVLFGTDTFASSYTTGTVTIATNSNTLTGVGTTWLANVEPGDRVRINTQRLRVKRVESDTSIVLLNYANSAVTGATYAIEKDSNIGFQLYYNPNQAIIIPYTYVKRVYDMVNDDYDRPELPEEFDIAILDGAEAMRLKDLDDARWINQLAVYASRVTDLKATRFASSPRYRQMSPKITSRGRYNRGWFNGY